MKWQLPEGAAHSQEKVLAPPRRPLEEAKSRPSGPQLVAEIIPEGPIFKGIPKKPQNRQHLSEKVLPAVLYFPRWNRAALSHRRLSFPAFEDVQG